MDAHQEALIKKIERLRKSCETLEFENNVFEQYYQREVGTTPDKEETRGPTQSRKSFVHKTNDQCQANKIKSQSIVKPPTEEEIQAVIQMLEDHEARSQMKDISEVVNSLIERKKMEPDFDPLKDSLNDIPKTGLVVGEKLTKPVSSTVINFNISPRTLNRLSNENKADLVMAEIDEIEHEISWQKECTQKTIFNGKALMEFLDQKTKDHIKSQAEFEREARNSIHYSSKNYQAEKIERFFEEKKRMKESLSKKIMLKTGTLGTQIRKLNVQIQQKEEMGGVLHRVDLEQLQFENQQYQEKIDSKNRLLLDAKKRQTRFTLLLNSKKTAMKDLVTGVEKTKLDQERIDEAQTRLDKEIGQVMVELGNARADLDDLAELKNTYKVPSTMNYIKTKTELDDLRHKFKTWTRKVDIATIRSQDLNKKWYKLCMTQNRMMQKM
jgi:hypothetical protein